MSSSNLINKILIANRGEIACRLIKTCKLMNISCVAIYSPCDQFSEHVKMADEKIPLPGNDVAQSYLNINAIIEACITTKSNAILPGYGFLSENVKFASQCEDNGIIFIGPDTKSMLQFADKIPARHLAEDLKIPVLPASSKFETVEEAITFSRTIGYPVLVKSSSGGGGIGIRKCENEDALTQAVVDVKKFAKTNFDGDDIYVEKFLDNGRHVEVQIFGDGKGNIICLGERDCTTQRKFQKLMEESPVPCISNALRQQLNEASIKLGKHTKYQSVGTVEFLINHDSFYFLEVNTRLQVEHAVTEMGTVVSLSFTEDNKNKNNNSSIMSKDLDIVEWMIRLAGGDSLFQENITKYTITSKYNTMECRIYAEDPYRGFCPSTGIVTHHHLPQYPWVRYDSWITVGTTITSHYDPLLMKVIVFGTSRRETIKRMLEVLSHSKIYGVQTNIHFLKNFLDVHLEDADNLSKTSIDNAISKSLLNIPSIWEILEPGMYTSFQSWPGRLGHWHIGVPPSGPMDHLSLRIANSLVGNDEVSTGFEMTMTGITVKINSPCVIAVTGAPCSIFVNGDQINQYESVFIEKGILKVGSCMEHGLRSYLAVKGGFDVPDYLGSSATFPLGRLGGLHGRILKTGDIVSVNQGTDNPHYTRRVPRPDFTSHWEIGVLYGPHGAPDFFTEEAMKTILSTSWKVHPNTNRLGIRLIGPKPVWARTDGGEAGLHPSNIHDTLYTVGSINFTGDHPVILGLDGPSLGGFVCPITIIQAELWKIGQLKPGDTIQFVCVSHKSALDMRKTQNKLIRAITDDVVIGSVMLYNYQISDDDVLKTTDHHQDCIVYSQKKDANNMFSITYRAQGDTGILIEVGEMILDLKARVHASHIEKLVYRIKAESDEMKSAITEVAVGVRSVQVLYDSLRITITALIEQVKNAKYPSLDDIIIPSRVLYLPLAFDDQLNKDAVERYSLTVKDKAPYLPSNVEFVARINGLKNREEVLNIMESATYLVLGLGDVYLGSPCSVSINPCHRLVTSKYSPSRSYTPEGAVGIGGAYMCIYGMPGSPGGYQLCGRTLPIWSTYDTTPTLFRLFDQIRYFQVSENELEDLIVSYRSGSYKIKIEDSQFSLKEYYKLLKDEKLQIESFKNHQQKAFQEELKHWIDSGMINELNEEEKEEEDEKYEIDFKEKQTTVRICAPISGSIWRILVNEDQNVCIGDCVAILESMKMEFRLEAMEEGVVLRICKQVGSIVSQGEEIILLSKC